MARRPSEPVALGAAELEAAREIGVLLQDWSNTGRRQAIKSAAEIGALLRASCTLADGRTDWQGRGAQWLAIIDAALEWVDSPEERRRISSAYSYHLNSALREELTAAELEDAGLDPASPSERQGRRWRLTAEMARAIADPVGGDHDERVLAALEILKSVRVGKLSESSRKPLSQLEKLSGRLSRGIGELPH